MKAWVWVPSFPRPRSSPSSDGRCLRAELPRLLTKTFPLFILRASSPQSYSTTTGLLHRLRAPVVLLPRFTIKPSLVPTHDVLWDLGPVFLPCVPCNMFWSTCLRVWTSWNPRAFTISIAACRATPEQTYGMQVAQHRNLASKSWGVE